MPVYTVQLSDGRRVKVAGDREPSEADVLNAIGSQSESGGDLLGRMDDTVNSYEASLSPSEFLARRGAAAPAEPESAVGAVHEVGKSPLIPWSPPKATPDDTPLGPPSAAFYNTFLKGSYDFLNTPYGAMSLGLGLGPMWMKRLAGLGFAEQMTEAASEKAGEYSVTHDPTTGYEALFSAAPVPLLAHPSVAFGENVALTKGDALEIGSRELLKDIEGATVTQLRPPETPWSHRTIGISPSQLGRTAMDALATPEAESAVDLAFRQMQPGYIKTPWEGEGTTAIRDLQNDVSPVEPARLAERIEGGGEAPYGKVSYMREAEAPLPERTQQAITPDGVLERLGNAAKEARARLEANRSKIAFGSGPLHEIPNIRDFAIVLAEKIARGGYDFAKWSADAATQWGAAIKPHLQTIWDAATAHLDETAIPQWAHGVKITPAEKITGQEREFLTAGDKYAAAFHPADATYGHEIYETKDQGFATGKTPAEVINKLMSDAKYHSEKGRPNAIQPEAAAAKDVTEGIDFENITRPHRAGVERGLTLTESDVPLLEQQKKAAYEDALKSAEGDNKAFKANFGKGVYLEGVIEGAKRQGPNYDAYLQEKATTLPEGQPTEKVGTTEASPASNAGRGPFSFQTTKGSTYEVLDDGTTIRTKAARVEHPGDFGVKDRSTKTVYVTPEVAQQVLDHVNVIHDRGEGAIVLDTSGNAVFGIYETGPRKGDPIKWLSVTPVSVASSVPKVGLVPLELWKKGGLNESFHVGNEIIKVAQHPNAVNWLESLKYPVDERGVIANPEGKTFTLPHPDAVKQIGKGVWNDAIDVAIAAIKAGKAAKEAISNAIDYLKKRVSGFDEIKMRENLSKLLELEAPQVAGDKSEMRKSASRATRSRMVPEPVQEKIAQAPESFYKVQPMKSVEGTVAAMPDAELAAVPENSNIHVAAKLELSRRLFDAGKLDEGYEVFKQVSKTGTEFGQNINQFKFLKGQNPINVVHIVNRGLKESGRDPLTKDQAESLAKTSKASIDANKALDDAKDKWLKDPTDANAATADAAMKAVNESDLATQREMAKFKVKTWPKMLKAFVQGNPLTPISQVANIVGNSLGAAMEAGSRGIAASLDAVRSMLTGGERKVAVQPFRGTAEAAKGFARGAAKAPSIMLRGSGDVVKGDTRAQLQPLRALAKAFAKNPDVPTVGGQVPFNERARLAVEGVFGIAPEVMLRMLAAADKPAYESGRARLIAEQSKLQNLPPEKARMAQKFPELFFDRESLERINEEASAAVFQRKSKTVSYLENLIKDKGGDWGDLAFTLLVAPYRLTPWNLVGRTLIYNPLVAALRTGIDAAKGNTRGAEINSGRMIVGGMLYTAGYFLYKNGLIGPSLDSRDEQQKARLLSGEVLPPNHVNVDGLRRLVNGGDPSFKPGDETWDLTRGGGAAGAILSSVANIGRDFEKKPESSQEWLATLLKNSTLEQASFTINQSFLKGVTGILDAVRDRNLGPYINSVENMLLNVPTPNTLSTLSRATREYVPDLSADKLSDELSNVVRDRFGVAGLDDYLPLKRDLWGKPMRQTPEGRNALLYHLFDISKNKQVTDDPVALELYQVWRETSDPKAIPSLPMRNLTLNNQTYLLNPKQYERYAELTGQYRRQIVETLVTNPNWQNLDSENKIKVLDSAYDQGQQIGKALLLKESLGQLAEKSKPAGFRTK